MTAGTNITAYIDAFDYEGNHNSTATSFVMSEAPLPPNNFTLMTNVTDFDIKNLTTTIAFSGSAEVHQKNFSRDHPTQFVSEDTNNRNGRAYDFDHRLDNESTTDFYKMTLVKVPRSLHAFGIPQNFPFDEYYLNLSFAIPVSNSSFEFDPITFNPLLEASWDHHYSTHSVANNTTFCNETKGALGGC